MTTPTVKKNHQIRELSQAEGRKLFDRQARRYLGMSGDEFMRAWREGKFGDDPDRPEIVRLVMLMPFAE